VRRQIQKPRSSDAAEGEATMAAGMARSAANEIRIRLFEQLEPELFPFGRASAGYVVDP